MNLDSFNRDGIVFADQRLSGPQLADVWDFLDPRLIMLGGHVTRYAVAGKITTHELLEDQERHKEHALGCYRFEDAILCPHLLDAALGYIDFAALYLGREPILYSMNLWWAFPGGPTKPETQIFHRDPDDIKFAALFFYLTDCSTEGEHRFKIGTQDGAEDGEIVNMNGPAGSMFFADTRGIHLGAKPISRPRLAAWARFGVSDPPNTYSSDGLAPLAYPNFHRMSERERRIARLIVKEP